MLIQNDSGGICVRKMCTYCGKWFDLIDLTPLYEKNKSFVLCYCDTCLPEVRFNMGKMPCGDRSNARKKQKRNHGGIKSFQRGFRTNETE